MESTSSTLILLCLSAVISLAHCQYPSCPDDFLTNRAKYLRDSYIDPTYLELVTCTGVLPINGLIYTFRARIYQCESGYTAVQLVASDGSVLYFCDVAEEGSTFEEPTTAAPPTEEEKEEDVVCPSEHEQKNYLYSTVSAGLIEQKQCIIKTSVHGQSSQVESTYWDCKEGYERVHVRARKYRCVAV